uniref:Antirestriction protein ArdA (Plasmid) n=1 Tax=Escherichia coli TaxID=562 RepID=A0A3G4RTV7_ECOLX|nr:Antirestriction protein ArdA (plasmid) [Escherichia coli]
MFQDYEGFPGIWPQNAISTGPMLKASARRGMKAAKRLIRLWVDDTGETDFDTFRDAWWGEADSEEAFAVDVRQ